MLIGLDDFDVDMMLTLDDSNIFIYYSDFETAPDLIELMPLGSFDDETESYLWINLEYSVRLEVSCCFLRRDLYVETDPDTKERWLNVERFRTEFYNIPEVMSFFDQYKDICKNYGTDFYPAPISWEGWDKAQEEGWYYINPVNNKKYINWNNYPDWCQECSEYTYDNPLPGEPTPQCAYKIPTEVIPPKDMYFIAVVYFNGIYRTNPESVQDFGLYDMLTDIDFEHNKYSMVVDIKKFFTQEFQWFLKTVPGMLPFGCDFGTHIKHAVQTKESDIRKIEVENEINFFITNFNLIYGDLVIVDNIEVRTQIAKTGGDTWVIEVEATIKKERLIYRIEAETE